MIDHVEIRPWHDRHQFNGNCIVFSWGKNLHRRSNIGKKWVYAARHSTHYVDAVVDMKRNRAAFLPSCTVSQRGFILWLACFWSCVVAGFNIPAAKMALKAVLYLYPHIPSPPLLNTPKLFLICGCSPYTPPQPTTYLLPLFFSSSPLVISTCNVWIFYNVI